MKKLFKLLSLFTFFIAIAAATVVVVPNPVMATTTFTITSDTIIGGSTGYNRWSAMSTRIIELTATDDTADSDPSITINDSTTGITNPLEGWWLYQIYIDGNHAGTEPTQDSDITITEDDYDILMGAGTDAVDNNATNRITPTAAPWNETWTATITNNAVDGAIIYIRLILYSEAK